MRFRPRYQSDQSSFSSRLADTALLPAGAKTGKKQRLKGVLGLTQVVTIRMARETRLELATFCRDRAFRVTGFISRKLATLAPKESSGSLIAP